MAIDIRAELEAILGEEDGELVASNIAHAMEILRDQKYHTAEIELLLQIIRTGTYGKDIRYAIYEALKRLSEAETPIPPGGDSTVLWGPAVPKCKCYHVLDILPVTGVAERRVITVSGGGRSVNVDTIAEARTLLESGDGYDTVDIAEDSGITTIASNAFYSETSLPLKSISMPGVRTISDSAFKNCTHLEEVVL